MPQIHDIVYGIDDKPPPARALTLAAQHVLTMFGASLAVPLLLSQQMGLSSQDTARLISAVMFCMGLATLLQASFGTRLPIIQGTSFAFLPVFESIIDTGGVENWSANEMLQYIAGAIIAGSIAEAVFGFTGIAGLIRRYLSPVVIGPVVMLIGLVLFEHGAPKAGTDWGTSGPTILLVILFSYFLSRRFAIFQILPILSAIVIVYAACLVFSLSGLYPDDHVSHIGLQHVRDAPWLRVHPNELFLPWGAPQFRLGFVVAIIAAFLVSIIESIGDYHACSQMSGGGEPTSKQISRGIGFEGVGCLIAGLCGGLTSTSYSENIGLVGLTKVGSRYVVQIAAVILIFLGLFAKFGALAATIPGALVGGLYCVLFGLISSVGIQQLAKADLNSHRNLFIAGFSLFMGLSIPAYIGGKVPMYQPGAADLLSSVPESATWLKDIIIAVGKTGMAVAAISGIVLDNLIPGTDEERGLS